MIKRVLTLILLVASSLLCAEDKIIRVTDFNDPNSEYAIKLLKLALSNVETRYRIEVNPDDFSQARVNEEVSTGGILDLLWTTGDTQTEALLRPIRIPIFKGLLGYRIFIINKDDQYKFDKITTLDELRKLTLGQGRTWADTRILEANGFNVVKTSKYDGLFYMVEGGRFDAFPRGVHEPFGELAKRSKMNLAIEKKLMIAYKMPFYYFVSKTNDKLANDVETGLNRAIANGSFDTFFMNAPTIKDVIEKADMKNRKVFYLDNPTLTKETPLDRTELWFDPKNLP
jgi:hypothetical protein